MKPSPLVFIACLTAFPLPALCRGADDPGRAPDSAREWFQDAKFGLFVHWGVYSLLGKGEWVMNNDKIAIEEYEKLPPRFNPTEFDPAEWVSIVKRAGQKYITITSKHHDGFCMWGTKETRYNIVDGTPYQKDVLQMLSEECRKERIKLFFYHSHLDWHHPDYYPRGRTGQHSGRPDHGEWSRYIDTLNRQIAELCGPRYQPAGIWFDGWWDRPEADWQLSKTYGIIHRLRPEGLIGNNHHVAPFPGEDFQMFEQDLPGKNTAGFNTAGVSPLPLETCRTMNNSWGYHQGDRGYRPLSQQIRYLVEAVGLGSNLLLNVGPLPSGKIPPEAVEILLGMGKWLEENGEAIYGTRTGPWGPSKWGYALWKGRRAYFHLLEWPREGTLALPKLEGVKRVSLLKGDPLTFENDGESLKVKLPGSARDPIDTILAFDVDRDLAGVYLEVPAPRIRIEGESVILGAPEAEATGKIRLEGAPKNALGYWTDAKDHVSWRIQAPAPGRHEVELTYACDQGSGGSQIEVSSGDSRLQAKVHPTGGWANFVTVPLGPLAIPGGSSAITVRVVSKPDSAAGVMNLRELRLQGGFVTLFDGSLKGWEGSTEGYRVEDGVLVALPESGGNLYTEKEYTDFAFRFEFRLFPGSNNGLGIRTPRGVDAAYHGMEIQILDDEAYRGKIEPWQAHGSIYDVFPAKQGHLRKTGEWNVEEVIANNRRVKVILNGSPIIDANLDEVKDPKKLEKHPGLLRKKGYLGFLGHGTRVEFRNIRIRELGEGPTVD